MWIGELGLGGIIQLTYRESIADLRVLSQSSITLPLPGLRTRFNQSCILSLYNGVNQERLPWKYAVLTCLAACYKVVSCGATLIASPHRQARVGKVAREDASDPSVPQPWACRLFPDAEPLFFLGKWYCSAKSAWIRSTGINPQ